jgi:hypothetical protein
MSGRSPFKALVVAAFVAGAACGGETARLGIPGGPGSIPDAGSSAVDAACVPTRAMCVVNACGAAIAPTCVSGEWTCPEYITGGCTGGPDGGSYWADSGVVDAALGRPDAAKRLDAGTREPGDASPGGDAAEADGGPGCDVTGCPAGTFCEEQGAAPLASPPFVCQPVPGDCGSMPSCQCIIAHGGYSCAAEYGWSCSDGDAGVIVGCTAP